MRVNTFVPKQFRIAAVFAAIFLVVGLTAGAAKVSAVGTYTYPHYDVDINVNKDSTVDVTETLTYKFQGLFHGVIRDITLENPQLASYCVSSGQTCGGFEQLSLQGVYDGNGKLVDPSAYTVGIVTDEDTDIRSFEIKWTVWPAGQTFNGDSFTWQIKYRLFGSLGFIGADAKNLVPYLYWNALPDNRGGDIDATTITISLPSGTQADDKALDVYSDNSDEYDSHATGNKEIITASNLFSSGNFTVAYKLPTDAVDQPAKLTYTAGVPFTGINLKIDGTNLGDVGGKLNSLPTGKHILEFSADGYASKTISVDAKPGQTIAVDATLTPSAFTMIVLVLDLCLNLVGIILIPLSVFYVYLRWRNKGRDENMPATVIPLFSPPKDVHPYLLGSIKDEKVDHEDVTGSIIDLAYRGYIKIKEITEGRNYELTRLDGKPKDEGLNDFETQLLDNIFDGEDSTETKKLGDQFAPKYPALQAKIYKEMVDRGYFKESPQTTRSKYFGCGFGVLVLGVVLTVCTFVLALGVVGVPGPVFLGVALVALGISLIASANYMPAKTSEGSKVLAEVLGFRMYMYYAERYRVQGLTPEEFEKYLSYAVVFGIETEWANKFKDIYKGTPDWYEGPGGLHDVFWYSAFSRSFATSLNSTMYTPVTTSSASGGGWSGGGGSFGGFSGGGGGGGGSGAF